MATKKAYGVAVEPRIWALAEQAARKQKVSTSSYVEGAILWDLVSDANVEAIKIAAARFAATMKRRMAALTQAEVGKAS